MAEVRAAGLLIHQIVEKKIVFLLLQSAFSPFHWTPPKGHLEKNESEMDAAFRETEEECGIKRHQLKLFGDPVPIRYVANGAPKLVTYWCAKLVDPKATVKLSDEHMNYKWADIAEAKKLIAHDTGQILLTKCEEFMRREKLLS
ncbi:NUDIX domain [Nesidiocoris tenuis]|uniref:Bis(5'-nucleosyl)-tetraphosphatase [asymmetrical] n=1 Tax=Nesidiocoris tenuis TaxID=355587 RepID=A0ABN7B6F5_9HEMI|nr:NUDIX domain [Nesidiocoris tenuis]